LSGEFSGPIDHSATLDLDSVDEDAHVLVVGAGNSAADWVPRLLARGARVTVSTRAAIEPPHRPASGWLGALAWRASGVDLRWVPGRGGCTESTPVIDSRLFEAVSTGRVAVVGEVVALRGAGVEVRGGETLDVDRIVFATGFVRSLGWASGLTLDERNRPQQRQGRSTDLDGVWFMGLPCMRTRRSGFLRGLGGDAQAIARAL
jgi:putative flavoprotein involved in K+ transport